MVLFLRVAIVVWCSIFIFYLIKDCINHKEDFKKGHLVTYGIMGAVLNFLDTLGVGSNATQMAFFKFTKLSPDDELPGNGNVVFAVPVAAEFILFLNIVEVDPVTLISMLIASIIGATLGARVVTKLPINTLRSILSVTLLFVAMLLIARLLGVGPFAIVGTATALTGSKLIIGIVVNFILGALMTVGVGLYAPCMALVALLGMDITAAFPIMMGSCAFLMPPASIQFVKTGKYNRPAAAVASVTGIIGVLIAYFFVKSMPTTILTWIVSLVLVYMSLNFAKTVLKERKNSINDETSKS
ncbi:sulfite exporter TauE/SafE family protein [Terrisporobacter mayombei]|uniref:Probable membrane transporter protein n=1 Tax=Terrisporobacter mayombei TaxID=1541 RepID=A0ABY9PZ60_9FIRM|nr:sulfite exporter TauE/SafE family protein [Terrisporobacter mayombei]MCC3868400.1 sulfite exporter TauE/SafE family protein [Terrisporobacter mayombei]WMT80548.1 hypothetical protein TEMA_08670 [Terrisporobacter mayombei]